MIIKLEDLVGKDVELLISGHFFVGRVIEVDPASNTIVFEEDGEEVPTKCIVDVDSIAMVKEG